MMVAVERVVEREAVRYPAVVRPGVPRSRILVLVPHKAVVMQVSDDLENEDGEHGLAEEEDAAYPAPNSKERHEQTKRQRIASNDLVVPPGLPASLQARPLDAPRVPQPLKEVRHREPVDRHSALRGGTGFRLADRGVVVEMLHSHVPVAA